LPTGLETIDSVELDERGFFEMEFNTSQSAELFLLSVKNYPWRITLQMNDDETVKLTGDALYLNQNYKIEGSEGSEQLCALSQQINAFTAAADSIYFAYRKDAADSNSINFRVRTDSLLFDNYQKTYQFVKSFCDKNKANLAGIIGLYSRYGDKLILDQETDFELFKLVATHTKTTYSNNIHVIDLNSFVEKEEAQRLHLAEMEANLNPGKKLPLINLPNPNGKIINTDSMRGRFLILSFWSSKHKSSWEINEALKNIQKNFNPNQLVILSVGMEKDKLAWVNTITLDNLTWNHVLANEALYETFNLNEQPRLFLVDTSGFIMTKNIGIDSINSLLKLKLHP
jgi:hypothetical protein